MLAFIAARYPDFHFGPIVLGQSYRNPAMLAKMAATLQVLSGGRLIMGIGAGWKEDEYHAYGYPYPPLSVRQEQLEDTLEIFTRMWTGLGAVSYQGKHYSIQNAYCEPKPVPVPPLIVGGGGAKTLNLAARYADWWNLYDANWPKYSDRLAKLRTQCAAIGRDMGTVRLTWFGRMALGATENEALAMSNGKWTRDNALVGTIPQVVDLMRPFVDAGVDYFIAEVLHYHQPAVIDRLGEALARINR